MTSQPSDSVASRWYCLECHHELRWHYHGLADIGSTDPSKIFRCEYDSCYCGILDNGSVRVILQPSAPSECPKCGHVHLGPLQNYERCCTKCDNCWLSILDYPEATGFTYKDNYLPEPVDPYLKVLDEMRQLHIKKAADYGGNTGTDNLRAATEFGIQPWIGCALRLNDKVTRIKSLVKNGKLENESIDDSLIDIAAYAILALCLLRESRDH